MFYHNTETGRTKTVKGKTYKHVAQDRKTSVRESVLDKMIGAIFDEAHEALASPVHATLVYDESGFVWHSKSEDDTAMKRSVPTITFIGYGKWVVDE